MTNNNIVPLTPSLEANEGPQYLGTQAEWPRSSSPNYPASISEDGSYNEFEPSVSTHKDPVDEE